LAEYVFYFLSHQLIDLWKQSARASASKGLKKRNSFYLGVLAGFREKLEANEKSILSGDASLAVVVRSKDSGLESFLHSRYPRLVKISHSRLMQDGLAFEAGKSAGRSLVLRQGISTNTQTSHRYLPKAK
jgi:hypothetical protein